MPRFVLPAILIALLPASAAQAAIYAGVDLAFDSTALTDAAPNFLPEGTVGPQLHLGYHVSNFAFELGYGTTSKSELQAELRFNRLSGDALYYVPFGGILNLVLTAGLAQDNYGASTSSKLPFTRNGQIREARVSTTILSGDELDWRAGGGFSFNFGSGYEFHVIGRYEPLGMKGLSDNALSIQTGFNIDLD